MCRAQRKKVHMAVATYEIKEDKKNPLTSWRILLVGTTAFLCYVNSLSCDLVFDDQPAIRDNKDLRSDTPLLNLLYNDFWGTPIHKEDSHKSYRPLCVLTFRLNYCLNSNFLSSKDSLVASLLFAIHPIHTEAVTGVVGRAELLSATFFLLALQTYIPLIHLKSSCDCKLVFKTLLFTGLAMLSKEQGITVAAVCITYDVLLVLKETGAPLFPCRGRRGKVKGPTPTWRKDLVLRLLLMTSGTALMLAARMKIMGNRMPVFSRFDNPASSELFPTRHLTHHYLGFLNAWLLLFPSNLCCDWTMGTVPLVTSIFDVRVFLTFVFYMTICAIIWKGYKSQTVNSKRIILALSLFVFPYLPASNLLYPVGFVVAERVLYINSMGFCMLVAQGFRNLCHKYRNQKNYLYGLLVIVMCLHTIKTIIRNTDWRDEESLFKSGLRVTQSNAKLYNNLGHVMESKERTQDSLKLFLQAADLQSDDLGSHLNVGRTYNTLGMTELAEAAFRRAKALLPKVEPGKSYQAHIVPRHLDLFLNLGTLLSRNQSRLEEAQEIYREAINMKSDYIAAYLQRASVLLKLNRTREAHEMYEEALKYDHLNPDIFYNMGVLLLEQGKSHQALSRFDQALRVDPKHEKSLLNYAILTQDSGDSSLRRLAHERLQTLLGKGRQPERTYFNLGMLAMQDGDTSRAESYFRKALELRGDFEACLFNLALVLYQTDRQLEAIPFLERLTPTHTKGLLLLGNIHFETLSNYTAAQKCYKLILQQEPNHTLARHNLCAVYFKMGKPEFLKLCRLPQAYVTSISQENSPVLEAPIKNFSTFKRDGQSL
ncbi:hypothetical protein JTE90_000440 [Oedothorax gibbosus]|uniref:dolichyl-phosphate-mannose--protein mannosyltransferase n=1 Tax=Oedothorax gibbosus TaxID=931172 RepID=A0AAV6UGL0_9ARAC|nr:hypothetical protein JTE90_000440 [Oedothorax gibbosus]